MVNVPKLKQNRGWIVGIWPIARRFDSESGEELERLDDDWAISEVRTGLVELRCLGAPYIARLEPEKVQSFQREMNNAGPHSQRKGVIHLRVQIKLKGARLFTAPITDRDLDLSAEAVGRWRVP